MIRRIIKIDEEKCSGCGLCAKACHEGAIDMVNGKAKLMRESYCDGLGDCLPACPEGAISFEEREAPAYDEAAVKSAQAKKHMSGGCPGMRSMKLAPAASAAVSGGSCLAQWPVQIKLAPVNAPYFEGAHLLVAADCTAYAYADFHDKFMKDSITLIGCPKLDEGDYTEKLTAIIAENDIKSITVARMVVPCCGGIERAVRSAVHNSGRQLPVTVYTISTDGKIL